MKHMFIKILHINFIFSTLSNSSHIRIRNHSRLFHNISHIACEPQIITSRHCINFYFKSFTTNACPCKSSYNSYLWLLVCFVSLIFNIAKIISQILVRYSYAHLDFFVSCAISIKNSCLIQLGYCFSAYFGNLSFKLPHT